MKLSKTTEDGNAYGYDTIEILVFNYDGEGNALVCFDDGEVESMHKNDLNLIVCGDAGTGQRFYKRDVPRKDIPHKKNPVGNARGVSGG